MVRILDTAAVQRIALGAALILTLGSSMPTCLRAAAGDAGIRPVAFHRITVIDDETGRGIPCIKLTTTDARTFYTDSAGVVALGEPDLMGKSVWFAVEGYGYSFPRNGFGQQGRTLDISPGSSSTLEMRRINVAQRLYRVTGTGIYRDSVLLGDKVPPTQDETKTPVSGMDSVQSIIYRDKMYWFWGDTSMTPNPLGNFKTTGAVSDLPAKGGLDPDAGVSLTFFRNGSHVRPMFDDRHQPIWVSTLRVLRDAQGREHLFTNYAKVTRSMAAAERGVAEFDDEARQFKIIKIYPEDAVVEPRGNALGYSEGGKDYIYYCHPWACVRSPATIEAVKDLSSLEAFTCVKEGRRFSGSADDLDRDDSGNLRWAWKGNATATDGETLGSMIQKKLITPEEAPWNLIDANTTTTILPQSGSVYYNEYRKRWISVRSQVFGGGSFLGEVWYFEADTPLGPWVYGQKIVTHRMGEEKLDRLTWGRGKAETYSFYNPMQHPEFDNDGGRVIYFEGTYTAGFTDNTNHTPGYNYNQVMYKLDLDDARVRVPVPVYRVQGAPVRYRTKEKIPPEERSVALAFFAPDRRRDGTVPVYEVHKTGEKTVRLDLAGGSEDDIVFYAVSPEAVVADGSPIVSLYEFTGPDGDRVYSTEEKLSEKGYTRSEKPLCRVWPNPIGLDPLAMQLAASGKR